MDYNMESVTTETPINIKEEIQQYLEEKRKLENDDASSKVSKKLKIYGTKKYGKSRNPLTKFSTSQSLAPSINDNT